MNNPRFVSHSLSRRHALVAAGMLGLGSALGSLPRQTAGRQVWEGATGATMEGLSVHTLCAGEPRAMPGMSLMLRRMVLEPGTVIDAHSHPGPIALFVESGRFGTEFLEGEGVANQRSTDGMWRVQSTLGPGSNVTMYGGDHLFYDGAVHTMRNDGDEPVVLLVAALADTVSSEYIGQEQGRPFQGTGVTAE